MAQKAMERGGYGRGSVVEFSDVLHQGFAIFLDTALDWDPDRRIQLVTFCNNAVAYGLVRYVRDQRNVVHVEHKALATLVGVIEHDHARQEGGALPMSDPELREALEQRSQAMPMATFRQLKALTTGMRSLEYVYPDGSALMDYEGTFRSVFGGISQLDAKERALLFEAFEMVSQQGEDDPERARNAQDIRLLRMALGIDTGKPMIQVAIARRMGLSQQYVGKQINRGVKSVRAYMEAVWREEGSR